MEAWCKDLIDRIHENNDKPLFREALECYILGYYRSSYIITWVLIVESLKNKIYEYASMEYGPAKVSKEEIERLEKNQSSVDTKIIQEAKKCEIINENEINIINFIWMQRCVFAHPYKQSPSNEEIKFALYQAVDIVLSKGLFYNKAIIEELIDNITGKPHFLSEDLSVVASVATQDIAKVPERLQAFFFKSLLFKIGRLEDDQSKSLILDKLRVYLVNLVAFIKGDLETGDFGLEHRAVEYPYTSMIGYVDVKTWSKIPERVKDILFDYLLTIDDSAKKNILKIIIGSLVESKLLEDKHETIYMNFLNRDSFMSTIAYYGTVVNAYERIRTEILSTSFAQKGPIIDFLRSSIGQDLICKLNNESKQDLGRLLYYSAVEGHWKSKSFVDHIVNNFAFFSEYLLKGICTSAVIEKNDKLSIDFNLFLRMPYALNSMSEEVINSLFETINSSIDDEIHIGGKIYLPSEKFINIKELLLNKSTFNTNLYEHFQIFLGKINLILGDNDDLPF